MIATERSPFILSGFTTPPRIISEIKKPFPGCIKDNVRPRITGELLCYNPSEGRWKSRRVAVRGGQLFVGGGASEKGAGCPKLALRRLNLTPGPHAHSFALRVTPDTPPLLTLQASNQKEFDNWVRTIAIELIRQTPLDAIKYLDIFTLTPQINNKKNELPVKDCNQNCLLTPNVNNNNNETSKNTKNYQVDENRNCLMTDEVDGIICHKQNNNNELLSLTDLSNSSNINEDEQTVENLLRKCQNSDSYVPVKEKLKLFESLCRLGKYHDDLSSKTKYPSKRTRSLHDLSHSEMTHHNNLVLNNAGVKEICKYFETKNSENTNKNHDFKYNTIARIHRTSLGPVKTLINRKYSCQTIKH